MVFGRRSSYRLGRRLKASAKARLDYITYLQSGGSNGNGSDIPPGQMKATITAGGLLTADLLVSIGLSAVISGDGELNAHIGVLRSMSAIIDGEGLLNANLAIQQKLAGTIDGGGDVYGHLFPPHRVEGTIDGGGEINAHIVVENRIKAVINGGGLLNSDTIVSIGLGGTINGGGELTADIKNPPPKVELSASIDGEGGITANISLNPAVDAIIAAMTVPPDDARKDKITDLVDGLMSAGIWDKLDCLYIMYAHDAQAARINWKSPGTFDLTVRGTPVFTVDDGYAGVYGSGSVLSSGWVPSVDGVNYTLNAAAIWLHTKDNTQNNNGDIGGAPIPSNSTLMVPYRTGTTNTFRGYMHATSQFGTTTSDLVPGLRAMNRTSGSEVQCITSNGLLSTVTQAVTGLPSVEYSVCGYTSGVGTYVGTGRKLTAAGWGGVMTLTDFANLDDLIEEFIREPITLAGSISAGGLVEGDIAPPVVTGVTALIVAGGGGGGAQTGTSTGSGGGGGGGVIDITTPFTLSPGTYPVVVGSGGSSNTSGGNSSFNGNTAIGGGRGGGVNAPAVGGSGGGGRGGSNTPISNQAGAAGTSGQGNAGGNGPIAVAGENSKAGGGGGGAGAAGVAGSTNNPSFGGNGGAGKASSITGTTRFYGSGGGGGAGFGSSSGGTGANGVSGAGGGSATNGNNAVSANRGGGGGGAGANATVGGTGAAGVVIIRYPGAPRGTGGTVASDATYTYHTFNTSGNLVIT